MDSTPVARRRPEPGSRLPLLDVLRGIAVLGTLAVNIWLFLPSAQDSAGAVRTVLDPLLNGKFYAMLAMMFGIGLALQYRSAAVGGRRWPGRHGWRQVLLLIEGALHTLLLFAWDVLMGYAVTALVVVWLLGRSARVRSAVMWTAFGVNLVVIGALTSLYFLVVPGEPTPEAIRGMREHDALFVEGAYPDQVAERAVSFLGTRTEILVAFPMVLFLFLLGVRLYRAGAFGDDERGRRIRGRLMVWGIGLGLPLCVLGGTVPELGMAHRYVFSGLLMLGYVGLTGWLLDRVRRAGRIVASLTAVGRTALSCYVLQNLLGSVVFYGWGLGLAGYLQGSEGYALDLGVAGAFGAITLVLVVGARWWTARYPRGPLESLGARLLTLVPERRGVDERPLS
ncbi:DUF418 domain-containing protein [Nocardiopsis sp. MG754419]|uniref:DUF418 domain-containing protein n=1 Tax=Nocardiopsis sp. MG754419 TaxID=2259865 RepID=UPI001BAAACEF|nr:DUF418 domain-containing protein [Nocardiopsis sp. MG754419]MBR8741687.1 hypothetical protein [Nocardiopsis sp. MG754419]